MAFLSGRNPLHFSATPFQPRVDPQQQIERQIYSRGLFEFHQTTAQKRISPSGKFIQIQQSFPQGPNFKELPGGLRRSGLT